ncbi:related to Pab1 dependent poly(A)-specific ribonuclease PAN3 [Sporisorium reilianum f. sp. reilianum]|uniref:PAN2-PAN3 deadenylation complex subunit PAN3 n=1 Tax=Sporisorium reilianum f. sp. reilianum TaxID=72559 RepID=A0A2N8UN83_9BASI|nr:related to Pab1 dependent poly(A)-specific ribonuclease PAN3 [Sporisorium reilianum f. sp. reilianum]
MYHYSSSQQPPYHHQQHKQQPQPPPHFNHAHPPPGPPPPPPPHQPYQQQQPQQQRPPPHNQPGMQQHHHTHQQQQIPPAFNGALPARPTRSSAIPIVAPASTPPPGAATKPALSYGATTAAGTGAAAAQPEASKSPVGANASASARKPCRNVAIYGHCKYQNDGCPFDHASASTSNASGASAQTPKSPAAQFASGFSAASSSPATSPNKVRGANNAPTSPLKGALSARNVAAAVFVPKIGGSSSPSLSAASPAPTARSALEGVTTDVNDMRIDSASSKEFTPSAYTQNGPGTPNMYTASYDVDPINSSFDPSHNGESQVGASASSAVQGQASRPYNPYEHMNEFGDPTPPQGPPGLALGGGMDYYSAAANGAAKIRQPLHYHLYAPPLPHVSNLHPHHLSANAFFLNPNQREELQRKQEAMLASVPPPELGGPHLPEELHVYHSLVPLEHPGPGAPSSMSMPPGLIDPRMGAPGANGATGASGDHSKVFGYRSHSYKATCTLDGKRYVLRRLEGFRLQHEAAIALVERWRRIRHPSIVSVREAFTTRAFGDQSIVFVYDYHPLATTLYAEHMTIKAAQPDRRTGRMQPVSMQVPERTLWSYLCQLTSALRSIHSSNLAARCIETSKVLRTGKNRVRINCCSVFDVIAYNPDENGTDALKAQQLEDLVNLGALIVSVGLNNFSAPKDMASSLAVFAGRYSAELKNVVAWLVGQTAAPHEATAEDAAEVTRNVGELVKVLGSHCADEMDSALNYTDLMENSLMKELENGRLVRLLCKFGFINERPEFDHDPRWAETGDRYVIKLFRDHVFHSVDEAGRPVVDLSHILTNLNKLDAGTDEKIMLTSRDEHSCLVVSYREIKNCIENAFQDLSRTR